MSDMDFSPPEYAGFWRRSAAILIDLVILGLIGAFIGFAFQPQLIELGAGGRLIGFLIAAIYFALLDGRPGKGQTAGKRLLKIKVVGRDGNFISAPRAFLRYLPLAIPFFLNGANLGGALLFSTWAYLISFCIFGLGLIGLYLLIFNTPSRRSLNDLMTSTIVLRSHAASITALPKPKRLHLIISALIGISTLIIPALTLPLTQHEPFISLRDIQKSLEEQPGVIDAEVLSGKFMDEGTAQQYLDIKIHIREQSMMTELNASRLANTAMHTAPDITRLDTIQITFIYGYDLGFTRFSRGTGFFASPTEWQHMSQID